MLYERWCLLSAARPHQIALTDLAAGRHWTFKELAEAAAKSPVSTGPIAFPFGQSIDFVLSVLSAWRTGQVVCPLEPGQSRPKIESALPDEIVHLKTTSASTAEARLVAFTAEQLAADATNIVQTMGLRAEWPNIGLISLAHSYGFSNLVTPLLLHGIPLVIGEAPLPEVLRHAALPFPGVTVPAVPALWRTWFEAGAIPSNVRLAISAGAPLPCELEQNVFSKLRLKIHNFYGSSECGGIAYDDSVEPRKDPACVGRPMRNVEVSLSADGCVEVRGAAVGQSYWPESDRALTNGVFRTTDIGEFENGSLFLRGRLGDQINVAGRKVSPESIEKVYSAHPEVRACLAFGIPAADPQRGDAIILCVERRADLRAEHLKQFGLERLPAWQVPRDWWFVDELKTNGRGKLSRAVWRKRYLENRSSR